MILIFALFASTLCLTTRIHAHSKECFYEELDPHGKKKIKIIFQYQVTSGGMLDIDVEVYDPEGALLFENKKKSDGKFQHETRKKGLYKFCFSNEMSALTQKVVQFSIDSGDLFDPNLANLEELDPVEKNIMRLSEGLSEVQKQQSYLRQKESMHRDLIEETNSRIVIWSFLQVFALVGMTVWQVFYLKRLFSGRRGV